MDGIYLSWQQQITLPISGARTKLMWSVGHSGDKEGFKEQVGFYVKIEYENDGASRGVIEENFDVSVSGDNSQAFGFNIL